jgi:flagellin
MPKINTNTPAMFSAGALKRTERTLALSLEKLSTGNSINRSSDNAAGLSISEQLRMQANGLTQGNRNINDGMSVLNIAEGGLVEIQNMLQRLRELALQSATDTLADSQREFIQLEVSQLIDEIDRIAASTRFNGKSMLNGNPGVPGTHGYNEWESNEGGIIHIGANHTTDSDRSDILRVRFTPSNAERLGLRDVRGEGWFPNPRHDPADDDSEEFRDILSLLTSEEAQGAITIIDNALDSVNKLRADIGSYVNRLEHALTSQSNVLVNVEAAESQIRHTDFAKEMVQFTRMQIMQQASTSMLAQANSLPNNILALLN